MSEEAADALVTALLDGGEAGKKRKKTTVEKKRVVRRETVVEAIKERIGWYARMALSCDRRIDQSKTSACRDVAAQQRPTEHP